MVEMAGLPGVLQAPHLLQHLGVFVDDADAQGEHLIVEQLVNVHDVVRRHVWPALSIAHIRARDEAHLPLRLDEVVNAAPSFKR